MFTSIIAFVSSKVLMTGTRLLRSRRRQDRDHICSVTDHPLLSTLRPYKSVLKVTVFSSGLFIGVDSVLLDRSSSVYGWMEGRKSGKYPKGNLIYSNGPTNIFGIKKTVDSLFFYPIMREEGKKTCYTIKRHGAICIQRRALLFIRLMCITLLGVRP